MSFKKFTAPTISLPKGTKYLPQNSLVLVSTGIPSLDDVLGGGLALGSVILVEEDNLTGYSKILQSLFEAQAIASDQSILIVKQGLSSVSQLSLPNFLNNIKTEKNNSSTNQQPEAPNPETEKMKIAWRYEKQDVSNNMRNTNKNNSSDDYCSAFDISSNLPLNIIQEAKVHCIDSFQLSPQDSNLSTRILESQNFEKSKSDSTKLDHYISPYHILFDKVSTFLESEFSSLKPQSRDSKRQASRISIQISGSLLDINNKCEILEFIHSLKGLLRYSYSACMISFPVNFFVDGLTGKRHSLVHRIENLCDAVVELESFEGSSQDPSKTLKIQKSVTNSSSNEYHGLFHTHKLLCLNSLVSSAGKLSLLASTGGGSSNNLAFKLRRKKFSIETYHLPVEGGTNERRVPETSKKSIDF
ncbi:hypothetical protein BB558_005379 [Smittium angustum]|uniref:Elongator complex protein 4 n=1 Tax=Smittium angustum TaxID=133377 RepID=A0A2U1J0N0_SMIAN|nr:hypothetical protein BB558_005379 [Smittium angustum]